MCPLLGLQALMVDGQSRCATQLLDQSGIVEQSGPVNDDRGHLVVLHERGYGARLGAGQRFLASCGIDPASLERVEELERRVGEGGGDQVMQASRPHRACHLDDEAGEPTADPPRRDCCHPTPSATATSATASASRSV